MSSLEQRINVYKQAVFDINNRTMRKLRIESKDYFCKYETELVDLTNKIPHWQTYLTEQQTEIVILYLSLRNVSDVTKKLGWKGNSVYNVLFGNYKKGKDFEMKGGVLKKLREIYQKLLIIQNRKGVIKNEQEM